MRVDSRQEDALRPVNIERGFTRFAPGSVLVRFGETVVLCTASIEETVPAFLAGTARGWVTAEYSLLPGSTPKGRVRRETLHPSGRTQEIQRLIGRSLRMAVDLEALGPRTVTLDADVLQADGGTRTAAITGCYVALHDALSQLVAAGTLTGLPLANQIAAVSVGLVDGRALLDLDYREDSRAQMDMNVVMDARGRLIEMQATAEQAPVERGQLDRLLDLAAAGIESLLAAQRAALG